ncbi:hypothetical protein FIBSPDRAFT_535299 [Athelia psychrophila]|uniref:Secreted protein n=1 Tax=Athelia psychrophila TaxID=1759441 RepID=A0A166J4V6_9AGAM|nr:hypothetical protein FIBSPDRAFT_535299 [Fibularhizoctonia sp. CBS 109695]
MRNPMARTKTLLVKFSSLACFSSGLCAKAVADSVARAAAEERRGAGCRISLEGRLRTGHRFRTVPAASRASRPLFLMIMHYTPQDTLKHHIYIHWGGMRSSMTAQRPARDGQGNLNNEYRAWPHLTSGGRMHIS